MSAEKKYKLVYEKIVGYAVIKLENGLAVTPLVKTLGNDEFFPVSKGDEVLSIIPATDDYAVSAELDNGDWIKLGFEYGGKSYRPNWDDIFEKEMKKYQ